MGRDRRSGHRRSRPATLDKQPAPIELRERAVDIVDVLSVILRAYRREYEAGWPPGGTGLHVMAGQSDATLTALLAPEQEASRGRCRVSALRVNEALATLRTAAKHLTEGEITQPAERSADSVVTQHDFESSLAQREHKRRERELRA